MRHVVREGCPNRPYVGFCYGSHAYKFNCPTKDRVYVKILRFVEAHPKCTRDEIQKAVWGAARRGLNSTTFAHMLYNDLIDYDKNFRYVIRRKGKDILKQVSK